MVNTTESDCSNDRSCGTARLHCRWGIGISLLVRAAAVLNEILEMTGSGGIAEGTLEASFTFVNFSLAVDVRYQGKGLHCALHFLAEKRRVD